MDVSIAFIVVMIIMQLSLAYLNLAASANSEHMRIVGQQKHAIIASDRIINDYKWLAGVDKGNNRVLPQTIDEEKFDGFEVVASQENISFNVKSLAGDSIYKSINWEEAGSTVIRRAVILKQKGGESVAILEVKA